MKKIFTFTILLVVLIVAVSFIFKFKTLSTENSKPAVVGCTLEAKMCPDGVTYVGRQGPNCEFQACPTVSTSTKSTKPTPSTTGSDITLKIEEKKIVGDLSLTFSDILQDSRCPVDVQCIQAGSVNVSVTLSKDNNTQTMTLSSDKAFLIFGGYSISIKNVLPIKKSTAMLTGGDYIITFHIEKI